MLNIKKLILFFVLCLPVPVLAGATITTFRVSVTVVNPCKIGNINGHKFLYACSPKAEKKADSQSVDEISS